MAELRKSKTFACASVEMGTMEVSAQEKYRWKRKGIEKSPHGLYMRAKKRR